VSLLTISAMADYINYPVLVYVIFQSPLAFADLQKIPTATIDTAIYLPDIINDFFHFGVRSFPIHVPLLFTLGGFRRAIFIVQIKMTG
jgi:hypothetical protein